MRQHRNKQNQGKRQQAAKFFHTIQNAINFDKNVKMVLTKSSQDLYSEYTARMQKIADVKFSASVLQWDQETYLPPKGAEFRARQIATLSEIAHEWLIAPEFGHLLEELHARQDLQD